MNDKPSKNKDKKDERTPAESTHADAPVRGKLANFGEKRGKPWVKGTSGNPAGRPKGSRNKLGEQFLKDLYADWEEHGEEVLSRCRIQKPDAYLKVVAGLLPKQLNVKIDPFEELSDDELNRRIRELAGEVLGLGAIDGRASEAEQVQPAIELQALPETE